MVCTLLWVIVALRYLIFRAMNGLRSEAGPWEKLKAALKLGRVYPAIRTEDFHFPLQTIMPTKQ